jgi:hypothetical protein
MFTHDKKKISFIHLQPLPFKGVSFRAKPVRTIQLSDILFLKNNFSTESINYLINMAWTFT